MKYFLATIMAKGKKVEHGFFAEDKKEALYTAKTKYTGMVLKVVESEPPFEIRMKRFKENLLDSIRKKKVKPDRLIGAMRQLAVMTNAGISIHESFKEIAAATDDMTLQKIFNQIGDDINSGLSLSRSMENFRFELGNLVLAMVQLGEKTGNMAEALHALSDMLEEIRRNVVKFKKAMAYPRNVIIAMAIAFTILISYVVPQFKKIFEDLGANLPLPTLILLKLEVLINEYGLYTLATIGLTFFAFKYTIDNNRDAKFKFHQFLLKLYLVKSIIMYATLSRFTLVFSELVRAGIPIAEALETAVDMIDNLPLHDKLATVRGAVEKGNTLNNGLKDTGLFENMILQMVAAGESSGQLDSMLEKVTDYYKMKFDIIIDGLAEAIEPVLLFFIAGMVLLLALGIFLPMWDMGNAVQGRT